MEKSQTTCYCDKCRKEVTFHYPPVNHKAHAIGSILTAGLWLPFWLFRCVARSRICDECNEIMWGK